MEENKTKCEACSFCGEVYPEYKLAELDGKRLCSECLSRETIVCSVGNGFGVWIIKAHSVYRYAQIVMMSIIQTV